MSPGDRVVRAAGVVPVRWREGVLQVALVHRAKYDDWSWPKGKLDHGEDFPVAAVRETFEETGLQVRLGRPLPDVRYALQSNGQTKLVRYWVGTVVGGHGRLEHEIDRDGVPALAAPRPAEDHRHDAPPPRRFGREEMSRRDDVGLDHAVRDARIARGARGAGRR